MTYRHPYVHDTSAGAHGHASDGSALQNQVGGRHYADMLIQPVEYIQRNEIGFCEGQAIKYLSRWRRKGGLEDLHKARHCIDLLIELETSPRHGAGRGQA